MTKQDLINELVHSNNKVKNHNTEVYTMENGNRVLKLYNTEIITIHTANQITIDSGGWETATTKSYINMALKESGKKCYISQVKGVWKLMGFNEKNGKHFVLCDYKDGILV